MYILTLELWDDTGFVDGSAEYPSIHDTLSEPDHTYTGLHPPKESLFSQFKVKDDYVSLINTSYAKVTYDGLPYPVYMWVDSVTCSSDTPNDVTIINCHPDLWRTYLGDAQLGYGLVTKRIRGIADPIQACPYRYRLAGEYQELMPDTTGTDCYWMIINTNAHYENSGKDKISRPLTMIMPIDKDGVDTIYISEDSDAHPCITLQELVTGKYDEKLKLTPDCINSAFISPYPPLKIVRGAGTKDSPYVITTTTQTDTEWIEETGTMNTFKYAVSATVANNKITVTWSDGTTTSYRGVYPSSTWDSFVAGAVAVEGGLTSMSASLVNSLGCTETYTVNTTGMPIIKLDNAFPGKTFGKGATLHLVSGNWQVKTGCSITTTINTSSTDVSSGGTDITKYNFEWDEVNKTWGDYWIQYSPKKFPTYVLRTPSAKTQVVQGVASYDDTTYFAFSSTDKYQEWTVDVDVKTTDTSEAVLLDFDGNPVYSLPWGRPFSLCTVRNVITMTSAVIEVRFDGQDSRSDGTCAVIPLPSVDITSNAWSEYVYSGQRDYDITQRKLAAQQALVSSITGGVQNSVSTGVMGSLGNFKDKARPLTSYTIRGEGAASLEGNSHPLNRLSSTLISPGKPWSALRSAGVTGGLMAGASLASAAIDYVSAQYFNGKLQDSEDALKAKQTESLILAGTGWDWLYYGRTPGFVTLVPDDYSLANFTSNIEYNGVTVSEPTTDCSAYKDYLGPVQIQNLIVTGDIPVQAKNLIANTYSKGIRIKTINIKNTE